MQNDHNLEEICLNLILGKNKVISNTKELLESYWVKDGHCHGCVYDELNKLCSHYKPVKVLYLK